MRRSGLLAKKLGMTRIFKESGEVIPVTLFHASGNCVVAHKTVEKDGYCALQIGNGDVKKVSKPLSGYFLKQGVAPHRKLIEFRVDPDALVPVGSVFSVEHFQEGCFLDIVGTTIGRGFAGVMKRHNFHGLRASHGVSVSHRSHGSTGQRQDPGKVFKGKKMAGHMGCCRVTVQNLEVIHIDPKEGLIAVRGCVPGYEGSWVTLRDSVKKKINDSLVFPGVFCEDKERSSV